MRSMVAASSAAVGQQGRLRKSAHLHRVLQHRPAAVDPRSLKAAANGDHAQIELRGQGAG
jgi:hypothetical protein